MQTVLDKVKSSSGFTNIGTLANDYRNTSLEVEKIEKMHAFCVIFTVLRVIYLNVFFKLDIFMYNIIYMSLIRFNKNNEIHY